MNRLRHVCVIAVALLTGAAAPTVAQSNGARTNAFSFVVAGDMRNCVEPLADGKQQFAGACAAIKQADPGAFIIVPGDFDPPGPVRASLDRYLGTNYFSYFVVGNHEVETPEDMHWVRRWAAAGIPHLVRAGPPGAEATTYSFDVGNSHFIMLSDYFNGKTEANTKAGLSDVTLQWLQRDLAATRQPMIWVASHMPLKCLPDMDSGRVRHTGDSLVTGTDRRAHFLSLLRRYRVRGLFCGHTHNCSIARVEGLWQLDSGHARGAGDPGAPSTFLKVHVAGTRAWVDVYRANLDGRDYSLRKTVDLN